MAASLDTIAQELLEAICENFDSSHDWAALRLTNRRLERTTRPKWANEHFRMFGETFDKEGISELLAISKVPNMASEVIAVSFTCPDVKSNPQQYQKTLVECSQMLVVVFQNLPALFCVGFEAITQAAGDESNGEVMALSDISAIFEAVMFAAQLARVQLKGLYVPQMGVEEGRVGLSDYSALANVPQNCARLETFKWNVLVERGTRDQGQPVPGLQI